MSFAADITDDFDIIDDLETVTLQRRDLEGGSTSYTDVSAFKTPTMQHLVGTDNGGQMVRNSCRWYVKAETVAIVPRKNDRIVSSSNGTWEAAGVEIQVLGTVYVLDCLKV